MVWSGAFSAIGFGTFEAAKHFLGATDSPFVYEEKIHNQSKEKVIRFIEKNFFLHNRLVLIITGKGKTLSGSQEWKADGKLKKNVPIWLSSTYLSKYVLWFDTATPEKGGSGALFVYLKKIKE